MRKITVQNITSLPIAQAPHPFPGKHPVRIHIWHVGVVRKGGRSVIANIADYFGKPCGRQLEIALARSKPGEIFYVQEFDTQGRIINYPWVHDRTGKVFQNYPSGISNVFGYYHPCGTATLQKEQWILQVKPAVPAQKLKAWHFYAPKVLPITPEQKAMIEPWLNSEK